MLEDKCGVLWGPGLPWGLVERCHRRHKHIGEHRVYDETGYKILYSWSGRPTSEELAVAPEEVRRERLRV